MKKQFILIFSFFCVFTFQVFGQSDDFQLLLEKTEIASYRDSTQVFNIGNKAITEARKLKSFSKEAEIYRIYGDHYYYQTNYSKAQHYYDTAKKLATKENNQSIINAILLRENVILIENGETEKGKKGIKEIIESSILNKDTANIIKGLNNLANIEGKENKREDALKNYLKALKYATISKRNHDIALLYNNIGLLKWKNNQLDAALKDFEEGLVLAEESKNERLIGQLYNNIGLIHMNKKDYDKSVQYFSKCIEYAKRSNSTREMGIGYINIGAVYLESKKFEKSLSYYDSTIEIFGNSGHHYFLAKAYGVKAMALAELERYDEAEETVNLSEEYAIKYDLLEDLALVHNVRSEIAAGKNDYQKALEEQITFKKLNDSLNNLNSSKKIAELQVQYEVEKKENQLNREKNRTELLEKEKELEKIRFRTYIIFIISGVTVLIILFVIRHFRVLKKQQEEFSQNLIENLDKERERIAKDLHDDLGQRLSVIKNTIHFNKKLNPTVFENLETEVGTVIELTREISRELYPSYLEKIGLQKSIYQLLKVVQEEAKIICSADIIDEIDELLNIEEKTHIYRIIQEAVNNTIKHSSAKALKISLRNIKNGIVLIYRDNGIGLREKRDGKRMGLLSMLERVKMMHGSMQVTNNHGKGIKLIFEIYPKKLKL